MSKKNTSEKRYKRSYEQVVDPFGFTQTSDPNDPQSLVPFALPSEPRTSHISSDNNNVSSNNSSGFISKTTEPENNTQPETAPVPPNDCQFLQKNQSAATSAIFEIENEIDQNCYGKADRSRFRENEAVQNAFFRFEIWSEIPVSSPPDQHRKFQACSDDNTSKINAEKDSAIAAIKRLKAESCCSFNGNSVDSTGIADIINVHFLQFRDKWQPRLQNTQCRTNDGLVRSVAVSDIDDLFGGFHNKLLSKPTTHEIGLCPKTEEETLAAFDRWAQSAAKEYETEALDLLAQATNSSTFLGPGGIAEKLINDFLIRKYDFSADESGNITVDVGKLLKGAEGLAKVIISIYFPQSALANIIKAIKAIKANPAVEIGNSLIKIANAFGVSTEDELLRLYEDNQSQLYLNFITKKIENQQISPYANFALAEIINNYVSTEMTKVFDSYSQGSISCAQLFSTLEGVIETALDDGHELFETLFTRWLIDAMLPFNAIMEAFLDASGDAENDVEADDFIRLPSRTQDDLDTLGRNTARLQTLFGVDDFSIEGCDTFYIPWMNTGINLDQYVDTILSIYGLGPSTLPPDLDGLCVDLSIADIFNGSVDTTGFTPEISISQLADQRERERRDDSANESLPLSHIPVAHESVDCIGEQCGVGSRLRYRVRVIQPGRSLNNYHYAPEMLESSAALLEGVPVQAYGYGQYQPMFSHLPQDVEPVQPSGFALNRVGVLTDAAYESHDQFGEGLFATLIVDRAAEGWARSILDEATTPGGNGTGVSIFADIDGDYEYDAVHDELFVRVDAIKHFRSVDLASSPAAGGAIVSALEDACVNERTRMASLLWWIKNLPAEEIMAARNWRTW